MTDAEKIEKAANVAAEEFHRSWADTTLCEHHMFEILGVDAATLFRNGVAWRDQNPKPPAESDEKRPVLLKLDETAIEAEVLLRCSSLIELYKEARRDNAMLQRQNYELRNAARAIPDPRVTELVERMRILGQAMPPNAVSMEIQRALRKFEGRGT